MKNSNDTIGNRTRDLLTCSTVPQPTAPPRSPFAEMVQTKFMCEDKEGLRLDVFLIIANKHTEFSQKIIFKLHC